MPEISRFYGIRITIYFDDHPPSHFHAEYGEHEAVFSIGVVKGDSPLLISKQKEKGDSPLFCQAKETG